MRDGTVRNLLEYGFPLDKQTEKLIMKPSPKTPDHHFKEAVMNDISKYGTMIASFDNEPINVNIFQNAYPGSATFWLTTNHSINPPNLLPDIHTIYHFLY